MPNAVFDRGRVTRSASSAVKWLQRWRERRVAAAKPRGGSVSPLEEFAAEVLALIAEAWQTISFVAALRHNKMTAPMVVKGALTGEMFLAYVEQCLVPTLRRMVDFLLIGGAESRARLLADQSNHRHVIELSVVKSI